MNTPQLPKLFKKRLFYLVVFVLVVVNLSVWGWLTHPKDVVKAPAETTFQSVEVPSEEPIKKEVYKSDAGPSEPKYIRLESLGVEGFIQKVGVDQDNQVGVPANINLAGWFVGSTRPGENGLSIIDGHVDGQFGDGIFNHLASLQPDQTFYVDYGDGSSKQFKVKTVNTVATKDAPSLLFSQDPEIKSQLNLITCGGNFDQASKLYDKRVIVVTELVN